MTTSGGWRGGHDADTMMEPMGDVDEPPVTGNQAVDEALRKVAGLTEANLDEHPAILKEAQNALQEFLNNNDAV